MSDIPDPLRTVVVPGEPASAAAVATRNVVALDTAMLSLYDETLVGYEQNLLDSCPVIMGLFTGTGGRFLLYRPGLEPVEAPPVPVGYQILKSVGHSSMAVYQLAVPYLGNVTDQSWRAPMRVFAEQMRIAAEGVADLDLPDEPRGVVGSILAANIAFLDDTLRAGTFSIDTISTFARGLKPDLAAAIGFAAALQVGHWMEVLDGWRDLLGDAWASTYGLTNSLYVTRTNNIFFTMMAQYFGREAINDRLLLLETTEFETEPATMLNLLARIVSDRAVGYVFFKDYYLMDVELVSTGSRDAISAEVAKRGAALAATARQAVAREAEERGLELLLPPLAPFHSNAWPWRTTTEFADGPATLDEAFQDDCPAR